MDGLSVAVGFRGRQRDREVAEYAVQLPGGSGVWCLGHGGVFAVLCGLCRYAAVHNLRKSRDLLWANEREYARIGRYGTGGRPRDERSSSADLRVGCAEFCVLRLGLFQDRNFRVSVSPQMEKIRVRRERFCTRGIRLWTLGCLRLQGIRAS